MNKDPHHKYLAPAPKEAFRQQQGFRQETDNDRLYRLAYEEGMQRGYRLGYEDGLHNGYHQGYEDRIRDQAHNERSMNRHHPGDMKWHRRHSESWKWI